MTDEELAISQIHLVRPESMHRYNKPKYNVVIQIKSNGAVFNFPITDNNRDNSKSDLSCDSIGWVPTKNGIRPAFGHKRPNEMTIDVKCSCGNEFRTNTGYVKCQKCGKKHVEADVSVKHANIEFNIPEEWVFEENPHLNVPADIMVLAMAIAQYDDERRLDMWGVVEE
jgi:hypothetical protein